MDLALLLARLMFAGLFLLAAVNKLLGGLAKSRKALTDFGVSERRTLCSGEFLRRFNGLGPACAPTILALLASAVLVATVSGQTPSCYNFSMVPPPPASPLAFNVIAANSSGQVLVSGQYPSTTGSGFPTYHYFLLSGGVYSTLPPIPGAYEPVPLAINDSGQIVGAFQYNSPYSNPHGFLFSNGTYTIIDFPGSSLTKATGISNSGQIVGGYSGSGYNNGFILTGGNFSPIDIAGTCATGNHCETNPTAINDARQVVGYTVTGPIGASIFQGFLLSSGVSTAIDFPTMSTPANGTILSGINNSGQIVGYDTGTGDAFTLTTSDLGQGSPLSVCSSPGTVLTSGIGPGIGMNITNTGQIVSNFSLYSATGPIDLIGILTPGIALLDPVPLLMDGPNVVSVQKDPELLATQGRVVHGAAADGVTEVVLRIAANNPGDALTLTLLNDQSPTAQSGSSDEDGALGNPGDTTFTQSKITVTAEATTVGTFAFAVYRAPKDFARLSGGVAGSYKSGTCGKVAATDDQLACRFVTIQVQNAAGAVESTTNITIVRPPVVLIHGNWSDPSAWRFFQPLVSSYYPSLVTDNRFNVYLLDYSQDLKYGVVYSASWALPQLASFVRQFKGQMQVASVQADVVGYSMGGLIAREWAKQLLFRPPNFNQGDVHKLLTIDTPHLGSELANNLLASNAGCKSVFGKGGNPVGQNVVDLAVGSILLQSLNTVTAPLHILAHTIVGTADDQETAAANNAYFAPQGWKQYLLSHACPSLLPPVGYQMLFTNANNPTGMSDLVVSRYSQLASSLNVNGAANGIPSSDLPESVVHTVNPVTFPLGPDVLNRTLDSQGDFMGVSPPVSTGALVIQFLNTPVQNTGSFQPIAP